MGVKDEEIVECLREAAAAKHPVDVRGHGTFAGRLAGQPVDPITVDMAGRSGIVRYEPADLTITVEANTPISELDQTLRAHGQECALDVWGVTAGAGTVAGRVAAGLAGRRALSRGTVRDVVLGIRFVSGDGIVASAGGATVKNVTGYDMVRLLVGSWGTLGVFTEVTLKLSPLPAHTEWYVAEEGTVEVRQLYAPSAVVRVDGLVHVLLEGDPRDCADQARGVGLRPGPVPEVVSDVRIAVPPALTGQFQDLSGAATEPFLGVVHLPAAEDLRALRARAEEVGGRLLVLDPTAGVDSFRSTAPSQFDDRLKDAFDPHSVLAPWRRP